MGIFPAPGKLLLPIPTYYTCTPGWPGWSGAPAIDPGPGWNLSVGHGATGGAGSEQDQGFGSGCTGTGLASSLDNSGGGGGGGGGYYGGGGGGGADDYAGAGGGGGAGTSYTEQDGALDGTTTTKQAAISITLLPVAPTVFFVQSGGGSGLTCTIDVYCDIQIRTLGYPLPQITLQSSLPAGLQLVESQNQTYDLEGIPTDGNFAGDSEQVNMVVTASNDVAPDFHETQPLTLTWGPLSSLLINPSGTQQVMAALNAAQLSVFGEYASGTQRDLSSLATWASSDPSVATVSSTGYVDTLNAGVTDVSATWDGQSVSDEIDVSLGPATSVTVSPGNPTVGLGETQQFSATAHYANGSTADVTDQVDWLSTNTAAATIDSSGLATATGTSEGAQSAIFATLRNDDGSTTSSGGGVALSVSLADPTSIAVTPVGQTLAAQSNTQFTATCTYPGGATADITSHVTWSSSDDSIASFDEGTPGLLFVEPGQQASQVTVTATAPADDVAGQTQVNTFAGDPTSITIAAPDSAVGLGATEQLTATAHYADATTADVTAQVQWSSSDVGVATVSSSGVATGTGTQQGAEADISAIFTGPDLRQVTGNALVSLTLDHPTAIAVAPADPTMALGSSQAFTATGTYPN
ncbi:MAG: Ig-like domain-containing protein, partial [Solirubrobacteraceae bacterium]